MSIVGFALFPMRDHVHNKASTGGAKFSLIGRVYQQPAAPVPGAWYSGMTRDI